MPERSAEATWSGDLIHGHGTLTSVGSGAAISNLPISWAARTEQSDGKTSPEEFLAAAQAACFAMAFSNELNKAGSPPDQLDVRATCSFDRKPEGGWKVGSMHIEVKGRVPGLDAAEFERIAQEAGQACPVSGAFKGNVEIRVTATLES
jgi:osmotically inducible protein OsmC